MLCGAVRRGVRVSALEARAALWRTGMSWSPAAAAPAHKKLQLQQQLVYGGVGLTAGAVSPGLTEVGFSRHLTPRAPEHPPLPFAPSRMRECYPLYAYTNRGTNCNPSERFNRNPRRKKPAAEQHLPSATPPPRQPGQPQGGSSGSTCAARSALQLAKITPAPRPRRRQPGGPLRLGRRPQITVPSLMVALRRTTTMPLRMM
jgi:hypothetical protein